MVENRVGTPVRGEDCFGRDRFVELTWQKIAAGHVLLAAPRRFGKTSVMYRLMDAPRDNYKIVHADLEAHTDAATFLTELVVQLANDSRFTQMVHGLSMLRKNFWTAFRTNFSELEAFKFKIKLRDELKQDWQSAGEELFKKLSAQPHPVLFILDEFPMMIDRMARSETHREEAKTLLRWLRKLRLSPDIKNVHFLIYRSERGEQADIEEFNTLMTNLENDFYIAFKDETQQYEFACKLLRDWWLRHYALEIGN